MGFTMPPISPLFGFPPVIYKDVESVSVTFETDREKALDLLPSILQLDEPATATLGMFSIKESTLGSYTEAYLALNVLWEGEPRRYGITYLVTNDMGLTYGREVLGVPKKMGVAKVSRTAEGIFGTAERGGRKLFTVGIQPHHALPSPGNAPVPAACALRLIGQPEGAEAEVAAELIETASTRNVREIWDGKGMISFPGDGVGNEFAALPVKRIVGSFYARIDVELPMPRLLATM
jgi:acetoacetate decarboxylase